MKTINLRNDVEVTDVLESHTVGMNETPEALSQLSKVLRDSTYTDKPLAGVRETITNAADEHLRHGITKKPVVTLPTEDNDYTFSVRDFAKGLSREDAFNVFFKYFESTKRNCMLTTGCKGLGSKAISAICDVYQVISFFEGKKYTFAATVRGDEFDAHLVSEEETDEPSGILVTAQIPESKVEPVRAAFRRFYYYYKAYYEVECHGIELGENYFDPSEAIQKDKNNKFVWQRGIRYDYPLLPTNMAVVINKDVILDIHPSREFLEQTDRNKTIIDGAIKVAAAKRTTELQKEIDQKESIMDCFRFYNEKKTEIDFYKNFGLVVPTLPKELSVEAADIADEPVGRSRYVNIYTSYIDTYGKRASLDRLSRWTSITLSLKQTKILYLNTRNLNAARHEAIYNYVEEQGWDKSECYVLCIKDKSIDDVKGVLNNLIDGLADSLIVDANHVKAAKGAPKPKLFEVFHSCYEDLFRRNGRVQRHRRSLATDMPEDETIYYVPLFRNQKDLDGVSAQQINQLTRKVKIVAVPSSNLSKVPSNWKPLESLIARISNANARTHETAMVRLAENSEVSKTALGVLGYKTYSNRLVVTRLLDGQSKRFMKKSKKVLDNFQEKCSNDPELAQACLVCNAPLNRSSRSGAFYAARQNAKQIIRNEITL